MTPADEAASKYMAHKGFPDIVPTRVEKVDDEACWYYLYTIDNGQEMELEVDYESGDWTFTVFLDDD